MKKRSLHNKRIFQTLQAPNYLRAARRGKAAYHHYYFSIMTLIEYHVNLIYPAKKDDDVNRGIVAAHRKRIPLTPEIVLISKDEATHRKMGEATTA